MTRRGNTSPPRPRFFDTVVLGGALVGLLDGLDAIIFYGLTTGVSPAKIFQAIASGVLGLNSFRDGWETVLLGMVLHFAISFGAAAVYYAACLKLPFMVRTPLLCGPLFGLVVYAFMYGLVLPLSAFPLQPSGTSGSGLVDELFAHILLVGLPVAFLASRSGRPQPAAQTAAGVTL